MNPVSGGSTDSIVAQAKLARKARLLRRLHLVAVIASVASLTTAFYLVWSSLYPNPFLWATLFAPLRIVMELIDSYWRRRQSVACPYRDN